jgi:hypothetical protein
MNILDANRDFEIGKQNLTISSKIQKPHWLLSKGLMTRIGAVLTPSVRTIIFRVSGEIVAFA